MNKVLNNLVEQLTRMPGIGRKTAQRISFFILKSKKDDIEQIAKAITEAKQKLRFCHICFNYTENEICDVCQNETRNHSEICVVEDASDILSIERSGKYKGMYHVLGGVLSPIDNVGPENLKIKELIQRVQKQKFSEIIIATNPTREGEATGHYLVKILKPYHVKISRIARGLPIGSDLDLADEMTISEAFEGRKEFE
ncbi:MAG: recombination mediator RecR [Candidatus Latescibacteria bacterium]|nr:recombination mediator RecR [Candidatus Latescibacterota bacterium]